MLNVTKAREALEALEKAQSLLTAADPSGELPASNAVDDAIFELQLDLNRLEG